VHSASVLDAEQLLDFLSLNTKHLFFGILSFDQNETSYGSQG
jgi:hypothetical protein